MISNVRVSSKSEILLFTMSRIPIHQVHASLELIIYFTTKVSHARQRIVLAASSIAPVPVPFVNLGACEVQSIGQGLNEVFRPVWVLHEFDLKNHLLLRSHPPEWALLHRQILAYGDGSGNRGLLGGRLYPYLMVVVLISSRGVERCDGFVHHVYFGSRRWLSNLIQ